MKEFSFIQMLTDRFGSSAPGLILGIGDDCAHLEPQFNVTQLITTDMLTQGVHFTDRKCSWTDIGWRCIAVNLSDLAASGADPSRPIFLFMSMAVPVAMPRSDLMDFVDGVMECSKSYGAVIAGGDSTSTRGAFSISVTAVGYAKQPVSRKGAKPGDLLVAFGHLGMAGAGFEFMQTERDENGHERKPMIDAFIRPQPLMELGHALASSNVPSAMLDISDGLLSDGRHLAQASECDLEINLENIYLSPIIIDALGQERALEIAAGFGDDYALLAAVSPDRLEQGKELAARHNVPATVVGKFHSGAGKVRPLISGAPYRPVEPGYEHPLGR